MCTRNRNGTGGDKMGHGGDDYEGLWIHFQREIGQEYTREKTIGKDKQ